MSGGGRRQIFSAFRSIPTCVAAKQYSYTSRSRTVIGAVVPKAIALSIQLKHFQSVYRLCDAGETGTFENIHWDCPINGKDDRMYNAQQRPKMRTKTGCIHNRTNAVGNLCGVVRYIGMEGTKSVPPPRKSRVPVKDRTWWYW